MPKIRFSGRIIPAAFGVHINDLPVIKWKDADYEAEMIVKILDDEVHVDCTVAKYDSLDDAYQAYRRAIDFAKATVDLAAFATGKALTVLLEKITEPNGLTRGMAFNFPDLFGRNCKYLKHACDKLLTIRPHGGTEIAST